MIRARLTTLLAVFFLINLTLGWQSWRSAQAEEAPHDQTYESTLLFARVLALVRQDYVDESKVGYSDLTRAALRGMLASLDPHSQFLDEESFAEMQRQTRGEFSGLGIIIGVKDGTPIIAAPMDDSPSSRAGLLPGDHILKIDGRTTEKLSLLNITRMLKGVPGQKTSLVLFRPIAGAPGGGNLFTVELTRETIRVTSVVNAHMLPPALAGDAKIGYVRIEEFGENTSDELEHALEELGRDGVEGLVIDLRNNPGGLLDAAVDVAGQFLPPNVVVVSTHGRAPDQEQEYRAHAEHRQPDYPLALLINGYSASGAEIVAGALKDLNRAVLVGETTFGKGSVQTVQALGNGIGMRLTTAKYYTPSQRVIHEIGIKPDVEVPLTEAEERRVVLAQSRDTLSPDDLAEVEKAPDRQLERAIESLRSVQVYQQRQALLVVPGKNGNAAGVSLSPKEPLRPKSMPQ